MASAARSARLPDHQRVVVRAGRLQQQPAQQRLRRVGQLEQLVRGRDAEDVAERGRTSRPRPRRSRRPTDRRDSSSWSRREVPVARAALNAVTTATLTTAMAAAAWPNWVSRSPRRMTMMPGEPAQEHVGARARRAGDRAADDARAVARMVSATPASSSTASSRAPRRDGHEVRQHRPVGGDREQRRRPDAARRPPAAEGGCDATGRAGTARSSRAASPPRAPRRGTSPRTGRGPAWHPWTTRRARARPRGRPRGAMLATMKRTASRRVKASEAAGAAGEHGSGASRPRHLREPCAARSSRASSWATMPETCLPSARPLMLGVSRPMTLPRSRAERRAGLPRSPRRPAHAARPRQRCGQVARRGCRPPRAPCRRGRSRPAFVKASIDSRRVLASRESTPTTSSSVRGRRAASSALWAAASAMRRVSRGARPRPAWRSSCRPGVGPRGSLVCSWAVPAREACRRGGPMLDLRSTDRAPACLVLAGSLLALRFLALALHAGLLVVLASASLREDAALLDLLVEASQGALEGLVLTDTDFCQPEITSHRPSLRPGHRAPGAGWPGTDARSMRGDRVSWREPPATWARPLRVGPAECTPAPSTGRATVPGRSGVGHAAVLPQCRDPAKHAPARCTTGYRAGRRA